MIKITIHHRAMVSPAQFYFEIHYAPQVNAETTAEDAAQRDILIGRSKNYRAKDSAIKAILSTFSNIYRGYHNRPQEPFFTIRSANGVPVFQSTDLSTDDQVKYYEAMVADAKAPSQCYMFKDKATEFNVIPKPAAGR